MRALKYPGQSISPGIFYDTFVAMIGRLFLTAVLLSPLFVSLSACEEGICTLELRYTALKIVDEMGNPVKPSKIVVTSGEGKNVLVRHEDGDGIGSYGIPDSGPGEYHIQVEYCGRQIENTGIWRTDEENECHADGPEGGVTIDVGAPCTDASMK